MGRRKSSGAGSGGEGELLAQCVEDRRVEGERPPALGDDPLPLQLVRPHPVQQLAIPPLERGRITDVLEDVEADAVTLPSEAPGLFRLAPDDLTAGEVAEVAGVVVGDVPTGPLARTLGDPRRVRL